MLKSHLNSTTSLIFNVNINTKKYYIKSITLNKKYIDEIKNNNHEKVIYKITAIDDNNKVTVINLNAYSTKDQYNTTLFYKFYKENVVLYKNKNLQEIVEAWENQKQNKEK